MPVSWRRPLRARLIWPLLALVVLLPAPPRASLAGSPPPAHYVVFIVVDGFKPSYLSLAPLPHLQALIRNGTVYDQAWVGEMLSTTPNVHVTFGTGTLPRENGFLGFGWAASQTRKTVDFRTLLADGQIDPVLRALPVPSVAAHLHQVDPTAVSVAASGHKDYAAVGLGGGSATYELYGKFVGKSFLPTFLHGPAPLTTAQLGALTIKAPLPLGHEDSWAVQYALDVVQKVRPRLLMINLPEADTWGHWYGPDNTGVFRILMTNIDRQIGLIEAAYARLGILKQTDFIVTGDHSMMESRSAHDWGDVWQAAKDEHAQVARADGEGGAIWLQDPRTAKAVAQRLVALHPNHVDAVFYRSATGLKYTYIQASPSNWVASSAVSSALQYLVDTTAGRNGPDVWMLYREGYTVVPRNVAGTWKGTHGGATWSVQHVPLILSGPDIRPGTHSQFPARAIDIAPTIERLLGLPAVPRDGVPLADALTDATPAEMAAQRAVEPEMVGYVRALQLESRLDDTWTGWPPIPVPCLPSGSHCTAPPTNG